MQGGMSYPALHFTAPPFCVSEQKNKATAPHDHNSSLFIINYSLNKMK